MFEEDDDKCSQCGQKIDVEFNDFSTSISNRYKGHCACTEKAKKEAQGRFDFKGGGCRDNSFKQPTIGDLLRAQAEKGK